ncbi:uncharacterized protein K460DRAFT_360590 [Cucurbitaria berberidis CBS 394.84]|uniref:Uncharacterized protein n=1 Tax=Cucurbitaria berberidis CBS 394.84 TaxID=1168544 RepID=A0A9P4LC75_9PLEO|nr:uncharacterized protein K460DRAFT_360590 [Cucurbitaria berberidis CBS 394.84]KAF1849740.1 hypothetical protein K460DRAFT_360590 [Cucurbitaria berberidis CBS 394.84]
MTGLCLGPRGQPIVTQHYQAITFQQPYQKYSLEELRVADYDQGRRFGNQNGQAGAFGQSSMPPPRPKVHTFTSGSPQGMFGAPSDAWFYAPVHEGEERMHVKYSNWRGWDFSIGVSNGFAWVARPVLPLLHEDTGNEITVRLGMVRKAASKGGLADNFLKEVLVTVRKTPEMRQTALSSIFLETREGNMELRITLATASDEVQSAIRHTSSPTWTWAFDVDLGFLVPFYKTLRATHLMFYPTFPAHAVLDGGGVPEGAPYPAGSPAAVLAESFPDIKFAKLSKQFYCEEMDWAKKKLWRVVAVGSM